MAYSFITAKPRPTALPSLTIYLFHQNKLNHSMIIVSSQIVDDPSNTIKYLVIYTFTVPEEVDEQTTLQFQFEVPDDAQTWTVESSFIFNQITILSGETFA